MSDRVNVFRVEVYVVDFDDLGADGIAQVLENARYPNHCLEGLQVSPAESMEIGEDEYDDSEMNRSDRAVSIPAFRKLFAVSDV